jgi:hypothetical protein
MARSLARTYTYLGGFMVNKELFAEGGQEQEVWAYNRG